MILGRNFLKPIYLGLLLQGTLWTFMRMFYLQGVIEERNLYKYLTLEQER
jgi:hypothetical protein